MNPAFRYKLRAKFLAILATIGGAQGWEDMEIYGVSHEEWLSSFLKLPFGIPSADTYRRLFERISPQALEKSFNAWLSSLVIDLGAEVIFQLNLVYLLNCPPFFYSVSGKSPDLSAAGASKIFS